MLNLSRKLNNEKNYTKEKKENKYMYGKEIELAKMA